MRSYEPTTAEMVCAYAHQYEWKISFVRYSYERFYWSLTACSAKSFVRINIEFMQIIVHIFSIIYVYIDVINDMMETC